MKVQSGGFQVQFTTVAYGSDSLDESFFEKLFFVWSTKEADLPRDKIAPQHLYPPPPRAPP